MQDEPQTSIISGSDARNGDENILLLAEVAESVSSEACIQSTLDVLAVALEMVHSTYAKIIVWKINQ